ncbi:peptide-methionine (S)-S-oxide reductase MsrA [Paracoccus litorisediminis]|uniref:peptide-methionine (S)-S-oxide reductase MsrA n=1 Tax=Paracoccus litorisediminis TaxID=2006130 RepID=UPI0037330CDA
MISPLATIIRPVRLAAFAVVVSMSLQMAQAQEGMKIPPPKQDIAASGSTQTAVFAGGCFWGVQGVFQRVVVVKNAVSGYAGGAAATAHYRMVGSGSTGHAEAVRITYDPSKISYGKLLQIFFSAAHDPTQLNRQGPDIGTQYRTAIFPQNREQAAVARAYIAQLNGTGLYDVPIVTTIEQGRAFYPAEGYHQDYLVNNPTQPYIRINDQPKIENLMALFPEIWRKVPVLVAEAGTDG